MSHVHACLRLHGLRNEDFNDNEIQERSNLALVLGESGWTQDALQLTEQVVQLHKAKLGEDHPDTLHSMELLAYITERNNENSRRLIAARQSQRRLTRLRRLIRS